MDTSSGRWLALAPPNLAHPFNPSPALARGGFFVWLGCVRLRPSSSGMPTEKRYPPLQRDDQAMAVVFGVVLLVLAGILCFNGPKRQTEETTTHTKEGKAETTRKTTRTEGDPTTAVIALVTSGTALVIFGLNGLQLTKLSSSLGGAESTPIETKVEGTAAATKMTAEVGLGPNEQNISSASDSSPSRGVL